LNAPPGTKWDYSNLGYFILAEIVHRASGKSWPDFLQERLFKPLGMTTTRTTDLTALVSQRANGYIYRDNQLTNAPPIIALRPSGALLSSLNDLIKWDAALSDGAVPARPLVQQMWTPVRFLDGSLAGAKPASYGYGWVIDEYGGHRRIRHGGSLPGFRAEYVRFVDERLDIIVLTNGDGARPDLMAVEVASHFIPGLLPKRKLAKLSAATLASYAGRYERAPDNVLAIGVDGSGLSIQGERGGPQMRLTPESDGVFYISRDETYEFVHENGAVVRLDIRSPDRSFTAKRLP
jgi:CubicO group peptidase (beta-lactamase class C family)